MPSTRESSNNHKRIQRTIYKAETLLDQFEEFKRYHLIKIIRKDVNDENMTVDSTSTYRIQYYPSSALPNNLLEACMKLFELNMSDLYLHSSWGLDLESKQQELSHQKARFLIVTEEKKLVDGETIQHQHNDNIIGFAHFRFDVNDYNCPTEEVLYIYEIQVRKEYAGCGIGRRLMTVMELMAKRTKMKKLMLTVFRDNTKAMGFYMKKMNYSVDATSPRDADYDILSKKIG